MAAPLGNKNAVGNRGGGRPRTYVFTDEQVAKMERLLDWYLFLMEAAYKDKVSDKSVKKLEFARPLVLKIMDKLIPNKKPEVIKEANDLSPINRITVENLKIATKIC